MPHDPSAGDEEESPVESRAGGTDVPTAGEASCQSDPEPMVCGQWPLDNNVIAEAGD